jgi:hypothetical protein
LVVCSSDMGLIGRVSGLKRTLAVFVWVTSVRRRFNRW